MEGLFAGGAAFGAGYSGPGVLDLQGAKRYNSYCVWSGRTAESAGLSSGCPYWKGARGNGNTM